MSFLNSIKGAIWEDDPNATQQSAAPASPAATPSVVATRNVSAASSVNAEMVAAIRTNTLNRKTPYTALLETATKLESVIPDEVTRIKAAFATVGGQRTVESILQAIDVHVSDVDGERMRFAQATEQRRKTELSSLNAALTQVNESTAQMQANIEALNRQIQTANETINANTIKASDLSSQIFARTAEFDQAQQQFDAAAGVVRGTLEQQRTAISSILRT
jgi:chromosome segregation ATPase